ncbi:MAG: mannonate dehydratase [Synergistaceae bacterium]|nr:mannonate dehydratase [Synergistaceae bacterium]
MIITFRWYGTDDTIKLEDIRQIPVVKGIVSAIYDIPVGEIWPLERLVALRDEIEAKGLRFSVIESIPVHEDIKLGRPSAVKLTENYCESIRNMGAAGIQTLCYNFMPVFDWTRSNMSFGLEDGSNALGYDDMEVLSTDLSNGTKDLPGWSASYSAKELKYLFDAYKELSSDGLWENLEAFIKKIAPVAEEAGIKMGIHPDDPPWPIFGLPRIITDETALDRLIKIYDSPANGLTLCTGSLGASRGNDMVRLADKYANMDRITFAHIRNIKITGEGQFHETAHNTESGSLDILGIMKALKNAGFSGPIRPDHGRMIWGERGKPGYGLFDRALGAMYLAGLWEGLK